METHRVKRKRGEKGRRQIQRESAAARWSPMEERHGGLWSKGIAAFLASSFCLHQGLQRVSPAGSRVRPDPN